MSNINMDNVYWLNLLLVPDLIPTETHNSLIYSICFSSINQTIYYLAKKKTDNWLLVWNDSFPSKLNSYACLEEVKVFFFFFRWGWSGQSWTFLVFWFLLGRESPLRTSNFKYFKVNKEYKAPNELISSEISTVHSALRLGQNRFECGIYGWDCGKGQHVE